MQFGRIEDDVNKQLVRLDRKCPYGSNKSNENVGLDVELQVRQVLRNRSATFYPRTFIHPYPPVPRDVRLIDAVHMSGIFALDEYRDILDDSHGECFCCKAGKTGKNRRRRKVRATHPGRVIIVCRVLRIAPVTLRAVAPDEAHMVLHFLHHGYAIAAENK